MKKRFFYLPAVLMLLFLGTTSLQGQSIKKVIQSTVNQLSGLDLVGTWNYEETVVEFQSDNLLKKAGGKVVASTVESQLNGQLSKLGFQQGVTTFTFSADSTFTNITNEKKLSGKYSYDSSTKYITLKYLSHVPIKAKVSGSGSNISLLFDSSGLLSLTSFIGSNSGISGAKGISSILNSYDGMMTGMGLKKQ